MEQKLDDYPEYRQLLAAVIASPKEDTPRLVLADWLQERSCDARAEFIRVQVELARTPEPYETTQGSLFRQTWEQERKSHCVACRKVEGDGLCPYHVLRQRERELFDYDNKSGWYGPLLDGPSRHLLEHRMDHDPVWSRGFIEELNAGEDDMLRVVQLVKECRSVVLRCLTCTAADWLAHGDAIVAAHPVERVTLTTRPVLDGRFSAGAPPWGFRIVGRERWHQFSGEFVPADPDGGATRGTLSAEWPDITFVLPEPDGGYYIPGQGNFDTAEEAFAAMSGTAPPPG